MRKLFNLNLTALCATLLLAGFSGIPKLNAQQAGEKIAYVCPMKCNNAVYEKAGSCPVCGMTLIVQGNDQSSSDQEGYVCPACGNSCDDAVYDKPGVCATCGMRFIKKGSEAQAAQPDQPSRQQVAAHEKRVAILIFDGVQIIDYAGPYEVFGQAGFDVFTVAEKIEPITTAMGMRVIPRYDFTNHPAANILLIPGGDVPSHQDKPNVIKWIRENTERAETVLSVCNGAFFLAKAGLLDGLEATTFAPLIDGLQAAAPKAKIVSNKRFVDNGKIITSAGLSSGMDGALHVIEKHFGRGWAQTVATNLEYNWDPETKYVRAMLADRYVQNTYAFMRRFEREIISNKGDANSWETKWRVQAEAPATEVFGDINTSLATVDEWKRQDSGKTGAITSSWKFTGNDGKNWNGTASVEKISGEKNQLAVTVKIARSESATR